MKWLRRLAMSYFLFPLLIVLSILLMVGGGVNGAQSNDTIDQVSTLNVQVENYRATVKEIAAEYGMEEYVDLILAIMQIESGGNGNDPMQASESKFNTRYPHTPGAILDPLYSIECGVQELKECLDLAGVEDPQDLEAIKVALQGYNFGTDYISWIEENNDGVWSLETSDAYAEMMCERLGWTSYGDPHYATKVMGYYTHALIVSEKEILYFLSAMHLLLLDTGAVNWTRSIMVSICRPDMGQRSTLRSMRRCIRQAQSVNLMVAIMGTIVRMIRQAVPEIISSWRYRMKDIPIT